MTSFITDPDQLRSIGALIGAQQNQLAPAPPDVSEAGSRLVSAELESVSRDLGSSFGDLCARFCALGVRITGAADEYQAADDAAAPR
ncbi:MAG: hypothetical protein LBQ06_00370 [Frankiaceae bacterium]|nr:hypothetical protein [Frankiaceae bacterium]